MKSGPPRPPEKTGNIFPINGNRFLRREAGGGGLEEGKIEIIGQTGVEIKNQRYEVGIARFPDLNKA